MYPDEGVPVITEPVALSSAGAGNDAAAAFTDFVLSEEGQRVSADLGYVPVRTGTPARRACPRPTNSTSWPGTSTPWRRGSSRPRRTSPSSTVTPELTAQQESTSREPSTRNSARGLARALTGPGLGRVCLLVVVVWFFLLPLWRLVRLSLTTDTGVGTDHYAEVLAQPATWSAFTTTAQVSLAATALALPFALPGAALSTLLLLAYCVLGLLVLALSYPLRTRNRRRAH